MAGDHLRALVLDPILAEVGNASTLVTCPDDVLHSVPLDCLPLGETLVGDRVAVYRVLSLDALLEREATAISGKPPTLLPVGGIDFGAAAPSASREGFRPLPETRREVEEVAQLFGSVFERSAHLLEGAQATVSAFREAAPSATYLCFSLCACSSGGGGGPGVEAVATIGAGGGVIEVTGANSPLPGVRLEVPAGALTADVELTIRKASQHPTIGSEEDEALTFVQIEPEGTVFLAPAMLTLPYADTDAEAPLRLQGRPTSSSTSSSTRAWAVLLHGALPFWGLVGFATPVLPPD